MLYAEYDYAMAAVRVIDVSNGVGAAIRSARTSAQLTQSELAARLSTTQSAVSRWERGHDEPRLSTLVAIGSACGKRVQLTIDDGVDLAQIREHLALSPVDRLRSVSNVSEFRAVARPVS